LASTSVLVGAVATDASASERMCLVAGCGFRVTLGLLKNRAPDIPVGGAAGSSRPAPPARFCLDVFLQAHPDPSKHITLDLDITERPVAVSKSVATSRRRPAARRQL